MELTPGYKQTEVGVIPDDWHVKPLSEIVRRVVDNRGKTPPVTVSCEYELIETASISFVIRSPDYSKVTKFVSEDTYDRWFRAHPMKDDILISTVGEYSGASAILKCSRGTIAQNLIALSIQEDDPDFVFYWTRSSLYKSFLNQVLMNQAQPSLRVPWLLGFKIALPPLHEQRSIATALSDMDALLVGLDQLIAKKRDLKQAAMQQLLIGKRRLPGFGERKGYQQTVIGLIPEDWIIISIQTALDEKYIDDQMDGNHGELYPRSHEFVGYGVPYIGANDFSDGRVSFKNCKFISEARARKFKKGIAKNGDVLFAHNATVGPVALLEIDDDFLVLSTTATYFRCNLEKLNNLYFRYVLETRYFVDQYSSVMAQSTRFQVPITVQRKFFIAIPSLPEQGAIAIVLSDMDAEIAALEQRRDKTRALKQAMMQELLTGRIRLV
jgi:type I restriction enzyme S subunit